MNSLPLLSGPSAIPAKATHALICLHGFGASGQDFISLAGPLQNALGKVGETMALFCPHAPFPDETGQGRQWFAHNGWSFRDEPGLKTATRYLDDFLTHITAKHGIPRQHMAVLGFSQGAMTLLYALPALSSPISGAIALSGGLTVDPRMDEAKPLTPILFMHGTADDVWPADHTVRAEAFYKSHGYPTQLELISGLGHGVDARVLAHLTLFLGHLWQTR